MILRPRQRIFVDNCSAVLQARKNTIGIAPTGAGKTIMMAAMGLENADPRLPTLTLQHRDELVDQNLKKFVKYAMACEGKPIFRPARIDSTNKIFASRGGGWNFAMVQTLAKNLDRMPPMGLVMIDEGHHSAADTYMRVINRAKELNPDVLIYGTTATPNRGDKKALRHIFDNCGDQITIGELIRAGHLIKPRTFVVQTGVESQISQVKSRGQTADQEISKLLNSEPIIDRAIKIWMHGDEESGVPSCRNRPTIVFCSDTDHGRAVTERFNHYGVRAAFIGDKVKKTERRKILEAYDSGKYEVLVNVYILTEGFDHQPTSCVILFKRESFKSTMTQMIGRGLRKVDNEIYPGVIKDDCVIIDLGTSCITHGSLEDEPDLDGSGTKVCPSCLSDMPKSISECAICGHEFPRPSAREVDDEEPSGAGDDEDGSLPKDSEVSHFQMAELDLLQDSPFKYESFYGGRLRICNEPKFYAAVCHYMDGRFYALGGSTGLSDEGDSLHVLCSSDDYIHALQSSDDYMRLKSNKTAANKMKKQSYEPPTARQLEILDGYLVDFNMNKYRASCAIQFKFKGDRIRRKIEEWVNAKQKK